MSKEEQYCLEQQFKQAQVAVQALNDESICDMLTKEELAHMAVKSTTFDNVHLVAYELALTKKETAKDLYNELQYYIDKGLI